ncbi:CapA family protein [Capnocytophaga gingivalis]|uniref:CapA family protein n=1 Tax=Capnocytophaga gingivalis TaxID=1017 RepID=UPI0028D1C20B|nr:CapA family protein [Capnocytophaga gingivalis]
MSYKYFLFISLIFCNLSYGQIRPTLIPVQRDTLAPSVSKAPLALSPTKDTLSIVAVGDVMIGSAFPLGYLPKDDAIESFKQVKPYLKGDIVFGNLEGAILDEGDSDKCKDKEEGSCYAFRMPDRYGTILKEAGFNLMSTANNHANDFGEKGRLNTARVLNEVGIYHAGPVENKSVVFEKEGIKYGFCAFSPNSHMISINATEKVINLIQELRPQVDILIVSFHGGAEGASYTRVTRQKETFYGENRGNVYEFAHTAIDNGADIVLGHGPHVTRAVEVYKGKFIAYSMGNFNTYGRFSLAGPNGIAPLLDIKINRKGDFLFANVLSVKQTKAKGLELDNNCKVYEELKRLTQLDFPETPLSFEQDGIYLKEVVPTTAIQAIE